MNRLQEDVRELMRAEKARLKKLKEEEEEDEGLDEKEKQNRKLNKKLRKTMKVRSLMMLYCLRYCSHRRYRPLKSQLLVHNSVTAHHPRPYAPPSPPFPYHFQH